VPSHIITKHAPQIAPKGSKTCFHIAHIIPASTEAPSSNNNYHHASQPPPSPPPHPPSLSIHQHPPLVWPRLHRHPVVRVACLPQLQPSTLRCSLWLHTHRFQQRLPIRLLRRQLRRFLPGGQTRGGFQLWKLLGDSEECENRQL
jgi:hypothetical protein